jgi:hypothetical protein
MECEMKHLLTVLILSVGFISVSQAGFVWRGTTWSAAIGGNDHTYYLVEFQNHSWQDATIDLFSTLGPGYHLATITSQEEQDFLLDYLLSSTTSGKDYFGEYWLGGYQYPVNTSNKNDNWTWVTNEAWNYTNWIATEPNDQGGPGKEQHLGIKYFSSFSGWNDEAHYHNITGYIAESVPEPPLIPLLASGLVGLSAVWRKRQPAHVS